MAVTWAELFLADGDACCASLSSVCFVDVVFVSIRRRGLLQPNHDPVIRASSSDPSLTSA